MIGGAQAYTFKLIATQAPQAFRGFGSPEFARLLVPSLRRLDVGLNAETFRLVSSSGS